MKQAKTHLEAKEYLYKYTGIIKTKHKTQKKIYEDMILDGKPLNEIDEFLFKSKNKIKSLVKKLQSDTKYLEYKSIYSKHMSEVRKISHMICDSNNPSQKKQLLVVFNKIKETLFKSTPEQWDSFVEKYNSLLESLSAEEKQKVFEEIENMFNNTDFSSNLEEFLNETDYLEKSSNSRCLSQKLMSAFTLVAGVSIFGSIVVIGLNKGLSPEIIIPIVLLFLFKKFVSKYSNKDVKN